MAERRARRVSGVAAGLWVCVSALWACGCALDQRSGRGAGVEYPDRGARIAEAQRLADEGQRLELDGRDDQAIEKYMEAVSVYRDFHSAWNNMGVLFAKKGQYLQAREAFQVACTVEVRDPGSPTNLGDLYQKQRWYDDAARYYQMALDRDPYYARALRESVRVDQLRGVRSDATLDRIRRALEVEQDPVWREYLERQKAVVQGQLRGGGYAENR